MFTKKKQKLTIVKMLLIVLVRQHQTRGQNWDIAVIVDFIVLEHSGSN